MLGMHGGHLGMCRSRQQRRTGSQVPADNQQTLLALGPDTSLYRILLVYTSWYTPLPGYVANSSIEALLMHWVTSGIIIVCWFCTGVASAHCAGLARVGQNREARCVSAAGCICCAYWPCVCRHTQRQAYRSFQACKLGVLSCCWNR